MMALDSTYRDAVEYERNRLEIAEKWANAYKSIDARQFERGREDRVAGRPCRSANGRYLDVWYSV